MATTEDLDVMGLVDVLRHTDQLDPVEVALGIAAAAVPVLPVTPGVKDPLLTKDHIDNCSTCAKAGLHPEKDHGATTDPDVIRRYWSTHPDTGVGMKDHPRLVRVDRDHDSAKALKDYRKAVGFATGDEPPPFEAGTPGGMYRRRNIHIVPEGVVVAGGGTPALGASWYQRSGYVVVKGRHPSGMEYPPFHGDIITPIPAAALEALQRRRGKGASGPAQDAATDAEVAAFLDTHVGMDKAWLLSERRRLVATAAQGHRHATAITQLRNAFADAVAGFYPAEWASRNIRDALSEAGWGDDRLGKEWSDLQAWAVAQVKDLDPRVARAEAEHRLRRAVGSAEHRVEEVPPEDFVADMTPEQLAAAIAQMEVHVGEGDRASPRFRFHRVADRLEDIPEIEWDVQGYRVRPTFGTTAGELKTLKSTMAMAVATAQAAGVPALGHFEVPVPRPVLYVVGEGGDIPFRRRMARLRDAHGLDTADLAHFAYTTDTAPLNEPAFLADLLDQMVALEADTGTTGTVIVDPKYAVHPADVEARNLLAEGAFLRDVTAPIAGRGWSLDIVDHFNQTGSGNGLKRVTMAGAGEWADSWTLLAHRQAPDVDGGRFWLEMQVGSRQWGGTTWHVDISLGRFDLDLGEHDGDIRFDVRPADDHAGADGDDLADQAVALEIVRVLQRARRSVTKSDVIERAKGRAADTRRVLSLMVDDGRVIETEEAVTDSLGRAQRRRVLTLHEAFANVETFRPRSTS